MRTMITPSRLRCSIVLIAIAVAMTATPAFADPIAGVIQEATRTTIKVDGRTYTIEESTTLEDHSGGRVAVSELTPGTPVTLEVDDSQHLVNVQATVIR